MKEAIKYFEGEHDFKGFKASGTSSKSSVRVIYETKIKVEGERIVIELTGNGFLYNMVRIIAGTLVEVGEGRRSLADVKQALSTGERKKAGPTAPPEGLVLVEIREVP